MAEPRSTNQGSLAAHLRAMHERFVTGGLDASTLESPMLRPVVAQSWLRSLTGGVDPDRGGAHYGTQRSTRCNGGLWPSGRHQPRRRG